MSTLATYNNIPSDVWIHKIIPLIGSDDEIVLHLNTLCQADKTCFEPVVTSFMKTRTPVPVTMDEWTLLVEFVKKFCGGIACKSQALKEYRLAPKQVVVAKRRPPFYTKYNNLDLFCLLLERHQTAAGFHAYDEKLQLTASRKRRREDPDKEDRNILMKEELKKRGLDSQFSEWSVCGDFVKGKPGLDAVDIADNMARFKYLNKYHDLRGQIRRLEWERDHEDSTRGEFDIDDLVDPTDEDIELCNRVMDNSTTYEDFKRFGDLLDKAYPDIDAQIEAWNKKWFGKDLRQMAIRQMGHIEYPAQWPWLLKM